MSPPAVEGVPTMLKSYISVQTYLAGLLNRDDRGATAVEYGLMVALIAAVIVGTVTALGVKLNGLFTTITGAI
jgi:pilus assembly protein Flp/PilA